MVKPASRHFFLGGAEVVDRRDQRSRSLDTNEDGSPGAVTPDAPISLEEIKDALEELSPAEDRALSLEAVALTTDRIDDVDLYAGVGLEVPDRARGAKVERFAVPSGQTVATKPSRCSSTTRFMSPLIGDTVESSVTLPTSLHRAPAATTSLYPKSRVSSWSRSPCRRFQVPSSRSRRSSRTARSTARRSTRENAEIACRASPSRYMCGRLQYAPPNPSVQSHGIDTGSASITSRTSRTGSSVARPSSTFAISGRYSSPNQNRRKTLDSHVRTTCRRDTRARSLSPAAGSVQWWTVRTAKPASNAFETNGRCSATACTTGAAGPVAGQSSTLRAQRPRHVPSSARTNLSRRRHRRRIGHRPALVRSWWRSGDPGSGTSCRSNRCRHT